MPSPSPRSPLERDPGWVRLGAAIRADRERRGWTRDHLLQVVTAHGGSISRRSIDLIEQGRIACPAGVRVETAMSVWDVLGWNATQRARIQDGTGDLPPLRERRPAAPLRPAAHLTTRLHSAYPEDISLLREQITQALESVRERLIALGTSLPALGTDTATHHATAARAARQLLQRWQLEALADVEDDDYTSRSEAHDQSA